MWLILVMLLGGLMGTGCEEEIDLNTDEGLKKALAEGKKLDKALDKLDDYASEPEKLKQFGVELTKLYVKGGPHDEKVIDLLTMKGVPDEKFKDAYIKAIKSNDEAQIRLGAAAASELGLKDAASALVGVYQSTPSDDVKLIVLQAAMDIPDSRFQDIAMELFEKDPGQAPIGNFRHACKVLREQPTVKAVPTLLKAMFYVENNIRIVQDCKEAVLAVGKDAVPDIIKMLKGKDEVVNNFIKRFPEAYTPETVITQSAVLLGDLFASDAVPAMLEVLSSPDPIMPPTTLINMDPNDPNTRTQRIMWAESIGMMGQELVLNINEIGAEGHEEAVKTALVALFKYEVPFPKKFHEAVRIKSLVEVALRVNAGRVLAEQGLIDDDLLVEMLSSLTGKEWENEADLRPAVRATMVTDLVSYLAIASRPGWTEKAHAYFAAMSTKELNNKNYKKEYMFDQPRGRIADVKPAFDLADRCKEDVECYAKVLEDAKANTWEVTKAIFEIGRRGNHDHVAKLLAYMPKAKASTFAPDYIAYALGQIGTAEDVPALEEAIEKTKAATASTNFQALKHKYTPLIFTLKTKKSK